MPRVLHLTFRCRLTPLQNLSLISFASNTTRSLFRFANMVYEDKDEGLWSRFGFVSAAKGDKKYSVDTTDTRTKIDAILLHDVSCFCSFCQFSLLPSYDMVVSYSLFIICNRLFHSLVGISSHWMKQRKQLLHMVHS